MRANQIIAKIYLFKTFWNTISYSSMIDIKAYLLIPWVPTYHRSDHCNARDVGEQPANRQIPRWPCSGREEAHCARSHKPLSSEWKRKLNVTVVVNWMGPAYTHVHRQRRNSSSDWTTLLMIREFNKKSNSIKTTIVTGNWQIRLSSIQL